MLAEKRVDGLLVMCSDLDDQLLELLERQKTYCSLWGPET